MTTRIREMLVAIVGLTFVLMTACSPKHPWKGPKNIVFRTADGIRLMATLWQPRSDPSPAVLMIANPEQDRGVFRALAESLASRGVAACGLDLRIQGESLRANQAVDPLSPQHLRYLVGDVRYVFAELRNASYTVANRLGLIACSDNAEIALRALLGDSSLHAVALFSPVLSDSTYNRLVEQRLPVYAVSSFDDPAGAPMAKQIGENSRSPDSRFKIYFAAGRGSDMLWGPAGKELIENVSTWFARVLEAGSQ